MVGGVVGDERGDALENDPLVGGGGPVDEVRAEEPAVSRGDGGVRPRMSRRVSMSGMRVPREPMRGTYPSPTA